MTFKEFMDTAQPVVVVLSSVAVPLIVAYFGNSIAVAMKDAENRVKYVELAVSVLTVEPKPESKPLREWAVELLDNQAPVKLSATAKAQLLDRKLDLPVSGTISGNAVVDEPSASGSLSGGSVKK